MYIEHPIVQSVKARMAVVNSLDQLTYMDLSDIKTTVIPSEAKALLEKCKNLYELNLSGCGLQSLDNLPQIELTILMLGSNRLKDQELDKLAIYQSSLQQLSLDENELQSVTNIAVFRSFARLCELNLKKNPLCQKHQNYSQKIFQEILSKNTQLSLIDHFMRNGEILSDQEGKDDQLDGPEWLIEEQESSSKSGNQGSQEERKSISSEENGGQAMDMNMVSLYQQYQNVDPTFMVEMLNQHDAGILKDPIENCFQQEMQNDQMELEEEFQDEVFRCTQTKKIKFEPKFDDYQGDY